MSVDVCVGGEEEEWGGCAPLLSRSLQAPKLLLMSSSQQRSGLKLICCMIFSQASHYLLSRCPQSEPGKCDRDRATRLQRPLQPRQQPAGQAGGEWPGRGRSVTNVRPFCRYAMVWALWYTQQPCQMLILTSLTGTCSISINSSSGSTAPVGVLLWARLSRLGPPSRRLGGRRGGAQSRPAAACSQSSRLRGEKVGHHIPIISSSGICKFQ